MRRLATRAAADRDQPSGLQGAQAVADIALIAPECLHQIEMACTDAALSALILGPHLVKDLALQFRKASCRHEGPLDQSATSRCG